jgi:hypothetical protein
VTRCTSRYSRTSLLAMMGAYRKQSTHSNDGAAKLERLRR